MFLIRYLFVDKKMVINTFRVDLPQIMTWFMSILSVFGSLP